MLWSSRRLRALACCLLPGTLAGDPASRSLDGLALVQLDVAAQQADRLKPRYLLDRRNRADPLLLNDMEPAALALNTSDLATSIFALSRDPFQTMMQFLGVLFSAVRKEPFMKAVNELSKATLKTVAEFKERSAQLGADFELALQGELSEDQLMKLTGEYFLKETHLLTAYYDKIGAVNKRSLRTMPLDVGDSFANILAIMVSQDVLDSVKALDLNLNAGKEEFCLEVGSIMANVTIMKKGMAETKKMINGTQKMEPMMKNYLGTMKPELIPRIMWVLNNFLDMEWSGADAVDSVNRAVESHITPILTERLKCAVPESGAAPKLGAGLLAGLALLAQLALLFEGGLFGR